MKYFTVSNAKSDTAKSLKMHNGQYLVECEYSDEISEAFLEEAGRWCVKTFLHYDHKDLSYNTKEYWETTEYFPISQREIVIDDGRVAGFIRHLGKMNRECREERIELLYTDPDNQAVLRNVIDNHCSENFDCDIYYTYQLMLRSDLDEAAVIAPERKELLNIIY